MTRPRNRRISRYSSAPKAEEIDEIYSLFNSDDDFNVNIEERKALLKQRARIRKQSQTSRQRNESTSSDIIECEEIVVEKQNSNSPQIETKEPVKQTNSPKDLKQFESNKKDENSFEPSVKSKSIKWGLSSSTIPPPINFKDIITEEEKTIKELTKLTKLKSNSYVNNTKTTPNSKKSNISPIPIPRSSQYFQNNCPNLNSSPNDYESNSPKSFAAMAVSPPKLNPNPWKKIESVSPNTSMTTSFLSTYPKIEAISIRDIVRAEEDKLQNLKSLEAKPLHIISIEDKAIEELLNYYKAKDNAEEYIVVERVLLDPKAIAAPVWKRHQ